MTALVTQTQSDGAWVVRFTMPGAYSLRGLRLLASRLSGFSGLVSRANVDAKTAELVDFAKAHHLRTMGSASLAQYNPPWTPWFMRRNEVMIEVQR